MLTRRLALFGSFTPWRDHVIEKLVEEKIPYFAPREEGWGKEARAKEREMLLTSAAVLLVITQSSASIGAMVESGWAVAAALKRGCRVFLVVKSYRPRHTDAQWFGEWLPGTRELIREMAAEFCERMDDAESDRLQLFENARDAARAAIAYVKSLEE